MAGPKKWTEEIVQRRIKEGRGSGEGDDYSPWIFVQEFSSKGTQTRVCPVKLRRTVHTMSYLEKYMFVTREFNPAFVGYFEQFPMPRAVTMGYAKAMGIRHPLYRETGVPVVMTLDAIAVMKDLDGNLTKVAWDAKPNCDLKKKRVLEKLNLHTSYCKYTGLPHRLFTETSTHPRLPKNLLWARGAMPSIGEYLVVEDLFTLHRQRMLDELKSRKINRTVHAYCSSYDKHFGFPIGSALRLFRYLVWNHEVKVDLTADKIPMLLLPEPKRTFHALPLREAA